MKKRVVVTGGAGFIGSHVVDMFIDEGFDTLIIDNLSTGKVENINKRAEFIECDILSDECQSAIKKFAPSIINHHAAQIDLRKSVLDPVFDAKVNICGTINLLNIASNIGVQKFIFSSTGGAIYGEQSVFPASEEHPALPESPYGIAKLSCEHYIRFFSSNYHFENVILRYGNVYGPRQNPHGEAGVVAIFMNKMLKGQIPRINGDGKQTRDYVFVKDVVNANKLALLDGINGAFNVGTEKETDVNEIYLNIKKSLDSTLIPEYGPAKVGEQLRSVISYRKIESKMGWKPQYDLEKGMRETADYFSSNQGKPRE